MTLIRIILVSVLFLLLGQEAKCQHNDQYSLFEQGIKCRKDREYKRGFEIFTLLLKKDSLNARYLASASFFYTKVGFLYAAEKDKKRYYFIALRMAERALLLDKKDADAHYVVALALGHISSVSDLSDKIRFAERIRLELETTLKLNRMHAGACHMMGRWHAITAGFDFIERAALKCFLSQIKTDGTYEEAIIYFNKAIVLEPNYKMHMVALAETYYDMGKKSEAKFWTQRASEIISRNDDDLIAENKCYELIKKLNQ